jgi:hypothetical protein
MNTGRRGRARIISIETGYYLSLPKPILATLSRMTAGAAVRETRKIQFPGNTVRRSECYLF